MSERIFRIFNPGGLKEDRTERRRAQLRRAQKSYRDRKDLYAKSLEQELAKTRANETSLIHECGNLRNTVQILLERLAQHGISPPSDVQLDSLGELSSPPQQLTSPVSSTTCCPENETGIYQQYPWLSQKELPPVPTSSASGPPSNQVNDRLLGDLDPVTTGMEFVLTLERPCLDHIHGEPPNPYKPTGHALTVSAQLLFISPPLSPAPQHARIPSYDNAPKAVLDRLLNLSPAVCSEGELTPAQAWNYIKSHPHFSIIGVKSLRALTEELSRKIACHGYGAAVEATTLENLVFDTLIREQRLRPRIQ